MRAVRKMLKTRHDARDRAEETIGRSRDGNRGSRSTYLSRARAFATTDLASHATALSGAAREAATSLRQHLELGETPKRRQLFERDQHKDTGPDWEQWQAG